MTHQDPTDPRLIPVVDSAYPVGPALAVLRRLDGTATAVPGGWLRVLDRLHGARTIDEHADALGRQLRLGPPQLAEVRQALSGLAAVGALASFDDLISAGSSRDRSAACRPAITSLLVPTCDRPEQLERCIRSFAGNAREHGRRIDVVVGDDSRDPSSRARTREQLRALARSEGLAIRLAGEEERIRFCRDLAEVSGVPVEVVAFGLLGLDGGRRLGANRNALHLDAVGERVLSVDDDTVCRVAPHPEMHEGLTFGDDSDPTDFRFYADRASALADVRFGTHDLFGLHEEMLGRSVVELARTPDASASGAGRDLARALGTGLGRVGITGNGMVGDSGLASAANLLHAAGPTRARLTRSEADYDMAFHSREVVRGAPTTTLHRAGVFVAMFFGLDAAGDFPPFLSSGRNSDGVFALTLLRCFPDLFFANLPFVVLHDPADLRAYAPDRLKEVESFRLSELVLQCTVQASLPDRYLDWRLALPELGHSMSMAASLPQGTFDRFVVERMGRFATVRAEYYRRLLDTHEQRPKRWADDLEVRIRALGQRLTQDDYFVPTDVEGGSLPERRERTRDLVGRWGHLLSAWPAMLDGARKLKAEGRRVSTVP